MKTYAEISANLQQVGGECPEGWIQMRGPRPDDENAANYTAHPDGSWIVSAETIKGGFIASESAWRESEMPIAQQNVTAIEYGAEGLPGTVEQWKAYWLALRKWTPDNPDFPNSEKRPVRPS